MIPTDNRLKIAVFIDFDNVEIGVKTTIGGQFDIGLVLEAIKERGEIVTKIAYSDWKRVGDYSRLLAWALLEGYDPALLHGRSSALDAVVQASGGDSRELRVALEHAVPVLRTEAEGRQGVLGRQLARAAVRDPAGVGPGFHQMRVPVDASNQWMRFSRGRTWITASGFGDAPCSSTRMIIGSSPRRP